MLKKFFFGCFLLWMLVGVVLLIHEFRSSGGVAVILLPVMFGPGIVLYACYWAAKKAPEQAKMLFPDDYDKLKEEWGPVLKRIPVCARGIIERYWRGRFLLVEMSICKKALILSRGKGSLCVPYLQYTIERPSKNVLIIKDVLPEKLADQIAPDLFTTRRNLALSSYQQKDFDFIMSLVQKVRENGPTDAY